MVDNNNKTINRKPKNSGSDKKKEGHNPEIKSGTGGLPKNIWESYFAFANTDEKKIIVADDDGKIVELKNPQDMIFEIWNILNNPGKTSINLLSDNNVSIEEIDGKNIVIMNILRAERHQRPVFINNNPVTSTYRRNSDSNYRCNCSHLNAMYRDAPDMPHDKNVIDNGPIN